MEAERDKHKLDPWKLKHFEPIWGDKREPKLRSGLHFATESKTGGAVTRSSLRLRVETNDDQMVTGNRQTCQIKIGEEKRETEDEEEEDEEDEDDDEDEEDDDDEDDDDEEDEEEEDESCVVQQQTTEIVGHENEKTKFDNCLSDKNVKVVCLKIKCEQDSSLAVVQNNKDEDIIVDERENENQSLVKVLRDHKFCSDLIDHVEQSVSIVECADEFEEIQQTDVLIRVDKVDEPKKKEQKLIEEDIVKGDDVKNLEKCQTQFIENQILRITNEPITKITSDRVTELSRNEIYSNGCKMTTAESPCKKSDHSSTTLELDTTRNMDNSHVTEPDAETQIPEGMEIDSETLQRIHELEVELIFQIRSFLIEILERR